MNHLVHMLDKDEYREVRTNRNQYKITPEERDILATKRIGVLGLSVGQAVAVALSMERCFGELRIADFDILELSNLNRIRSGVQDLGLLKTVSTARQIAEIDPFLNVSCFHEGLTEENLDNFFLVRGKLDIVIDECDGLDIKILVRQKARELGVPVVMETSDRGMLDVERFDLEPDRPILHGLIDHLDLNPANLKGLTNEEKIPYILPMVGMETMSDRLKASMLEVEQSITTWPQLASDVILGGEVSANVCRRIALDQFRASGRFFVDINDIVSENSQAEVDHYLSNADHPTETDTSEIIQINIELAPDEDQAELSRHQVESLIEAAILAPSGGNSQPWRFIYENRNIYILLDGSRSFSYLDQDRAGAHVALGAAMENLILKAHEMKLEVSVESFPDINDSKLVAVCRLYRDQPKIGRAVESHEFDSLQDFISLRFTNRLIRERKIIEERRLKEMESFCKEGAQVKWILNETDLKLIGKLAAKIDRILITNEQGHHDFINEIRWSKEEADKAKDGIDLATVDLTPAEKTGFFLAKNWTVVKTLNTWGGGSVFEKLSKKSLEKASAVGLLTMPGSEMRHFFSAGRTLERLWLYVNKNNLSIHPMTAITFMLHQLANDAVNELSPSSLKTLKEVQKEFYSLFDLTADSYPILLFRVFDAEKPVVKSQRRSVNDILEIRQK